MPLRTSATRKYEAAYIRFRNDDGMKNVGYRVLSALSRGLDFLFILFFAGLFAIGLYGYWDIESVFDKAEGKHFASYKPGTGQEEPQMGFEELKKRNPDTAGWLEVYGTSIDYPVMQAADNHKYLTTDALGRYSGSGSIFLDAANKNDFSDRKLVIHGHHMAHHAMFGDLDDFADARFFANHLYGDLYYAGKHHGLRILAYLRVLGDDQLIYRKPDENEQAWQELLVYLKEHAVPNRFNTITDRELDQAHLVILSTCTEETEGRQLVVAQVVEETFENFFEKERKNTGQNEIQQTRERLSKNQVFLLLLGLWMVCLLVRMLCSRQLRKKNKK